MWTTPLILCGLRGVQLLAWAGNLVGVRAWMRSSSVRFSGCLEVAWVAVRKQLLFWALCAVPSRQHRSLLSVSTTLRTRSCPHRQGTSRSSDDGPNRCSSIHPEEMPLHHISWIRDDVLRRWKQPGYLKNVPVYRLSVHLEREPRCRIV